jgi:hypothetical protein
MSLLTEMEFESFAGGTNPDQRSTSLNRRAAELRAQYGREGKVVYDRLDRWREEHRTCVKDHEPTVERMIYVVHCRSTDSVAVCESWQFSE